VLLVDDAKTILSLTRVFLAGLDLDIVTAEDGEQALALAKERPPDVVVADVQMPKKDGLELCADLKLDPALRHAQIILLSAKADDESLQRRARLLGVSSVLKKPVSPEVLRDAVVKAIGPR
jgi:CheY-like chemotaxis protein